MIRSRAPGFSLLELLTALTIVAILASISVPSYNGFIARSRRSDAMSALLQLQLAQQRWRADNPAYASRTDMLGWSDGQSTEGYYQLQVESSDAGDYLGKATPQGAQQSDDCGVFAINSQGPVETSPYAGPACWNR
ncbi:type IV pilus assembly protein PilE [Thiogranum longum]|uniref:Type IV pilus assembly protein PilE n=1 Tax=Thiogranum longum TaxID=1537524 RepID=A0A4R1HCG6_9GAMM|nr:type IV pilin protein [Thiogranum longum]TCK19138.1 type IV pilus assembly protein PilE [Thiogranum longum]